MINDYNSTFAISGLKNGLVKVWREDEPLIANYKSDHTDMYDDLILIKEVFSQSVDGPLVKSEWSYRFECKDGDVLEVQVTAVKL